MTLPPDGEPNIIFHQKDQYFDSRRGLIMELSRHTKNVGRADQSGRDAYFYARLECSHEIAELIRNRMLKFDDTGREDPELEEIDRTLTQYLIGDRTVATDFQYHVGMRINSSSYEFSNRSREEGGPRFYYFISDRIIVVRERPIGIDPNPKTAFVGFDEEALIETIADDLPYDNGPTRLSLNNLPIARA